MSVRLPRIRFFSGRKHQKCLVQSVSQVCCGRGIASQVSNNLGFSYANAISANASAGSNQANINNPGNMAKGRCGLEENYRAGSLGSYRQQVSTPCRSALNFTHSHPLPLKNRFGRACRAFVNAWRVA